VTLNVYFFDTSVRLFDFDSLERSAETAKSGVARAAHIVMRGGGGDRGHRRRRRDDQGAYGAIAVGLQGKRSLTGLLEGHGTEVVGEAQDPERSAQCLIRVIAPMDLLAQQRGGRRPHGLGALAQSLMVELDDSPMALGTVVMLGGEAPCAARAQMPGDGLAAVVGMACRSNTLKFGLVAWPTSDIRERPSCLKSWT
jgi:hypothetical protein